MEDRFLGFRRYLVQQKRAAPNTVASYLRDVAGLDRFAGFSADIDYAAASPDLVSSYLNQLKDQGRKPSTLNRVRASISCYYRYLTEQGIANGNPAKSVPLPLPSRSIPAILTTAEMDRLLSAPNDHDILSCRDRAMLELLYATGLKVTALTALNVDDLHLDMGFLRSAGRHERMLPLYQTAVDKLREYIKRRPALLQDPGEPALFVNSNGGRLTRQGFWKIIKQRARQAGIQKDITPQSLRHSLAIHLLQNGATPQDLQQILGYEDPTAAQQYAKLFRQSWMGNYSQLHPRAGKKGSC
ncbi:MAG TPA: tyrosine-type recombinase/integrase [Firmicutes bacterium]|nr:tyrosine-type recombinase/integrase [Bacillota bacterium]